MSTTELNTREPVELSTEAAPAWDYVHYWQLWHHNWDHSDVDLVRQLCPMDGKTVLEVGCGGGRMTFQLASHCRRIIGADCESRFIEIGKRKQQELNLGNVEFVLMDAQKLELPDQSMDIVIYPWVLQMVENPIAAVKEAYRVLKPGGRMLVIGLRSGADYDRVIGSFVKDVPIIDPIKCYEKPIAEVFGEIDQVQAPVKGRPFAYFFETKQLAFESFLFALDFWYSTKLSPAEREKLVSLIEPYADGDGVKLNFPASIYLAVKADQ
jgi:SAM-dependent methyltransferase